MGTDTTGNRSTTCYNCGVTQTPENHDLAPINLDAIAEYLERHPEISSVVITEVVEEWFE